MAKQGVSGWPRSPHWGASWLASTLSHWIWSYRQLSPATGVRLLTEGFDVSLISSLASSRYREAIFNSWDKNEPKDTGILLELLKRGIVQIYTDPIKSGFHDIQELSKTCYHFTLSRTRLQHSILTHYLPLYFPEMGKFWNSTRSEWWINFLLHFPTPTSVTQYTEVEFWSLASPIIGRKVNKQAKLQELYAIAQHWLTQFVRISGLPDV